MGNQGNKKKEGVCVFGMRDHWPAVPHGSVHYGTGIQKKGRSIYELLKRRLQVTNREGRGTSY